MSEQIGQKVLPLKEVIDVCFAKTDMVIWKKSKSDKDEIDKKN